MTQFIPYFLSFVTLMFGVSFYLGLQEFKKIDARDPIHNEEEQPGL